MRFNNSSMALLDIPDLPARAFIRKAGGGIIPQGGGGGGSPPTSTTNTTNTSNIPPYAQPYVENMMAATQAQLFQTTPSGQIDPNTGQEIQNITGFQPYKAYGGQYDASGNLTNPTEAAQAAVAGFQPLQTQAQQGIAGLQNPNQYNQAMGITGQGIGQDFRSANMGNMYGQAGYNAGMSYGQNAQNPNAVANFMNPYIQNTLAPSMQLLNQQYGMQQAANQGRQTQAGAFGGSRGTLEDSLNQQNQMLAQNQLVGNAYNQAYNTANQNMQTAASLGMQGAQSGLAGIGAQQAGIAQGMAGANQLANLGQQQQANQENIYNLQNQYGAQQQQYNQNVINQAMQNYANAQQYPIMELGTMSNMLRGLPMQATTTNQYQATPSPLSQAIGAAGVGSTLSALTKGSKKGGLQKNTTGINSYDVGGAIKADLENMPTDALKEELGKTQSPTIKSDIQQIIAMRNAVPQSKSGGIMSYADGEKVQPGSAEFLNSEASNVSSAPAPAAVPAPPPPNPDFTAWQQAGKGIAQIPDQTVRDTLLAQHQMNKPETYEIIRDRLQKQHDEAMKGDTTRADIMAERSNAKAESERQRQLRLGQFFASWGSTPGPTLVAGLSAFAKTVPSMIADSDKQAEIMNRIDHSIIELNRADRMERMGMDKEAAKLKQEQSKNIQALNKDIIVYKDAQDQMASRERIAKFEADSRIKAAQIGLGSKEERDFNEKMKLYGIASDQSEKVKENIAREKGLKTEYGDAVKKYNQFEAIEKDGTKLNPMMQSLKDNAEKTIRAYETEWNSRIEAAEKKKNLIGQAFAPEFKKHGVDINDTAAPEKPVDKDKRAPISSFYK